MSTCDTCNSDDDEELLKELQHTLHRPTLKSVKIPVVNYPLTSNILESLSNVFHKISASQCIVDYINRGQDINMHLRTSTSNLQPHYQKIIKCLDEKAQSIKDLLKTTADYIILYRSMTKEYNRDLALGYMSTSNKLITEGFGNLYYMKIYVPTTIKVLIADITKEAKGKENEKIFEIILPRNTILQKFGEKNEINYFLAIDKNAPDYLLQRIANQIEDDLGQ